MERGICCFRCCATHSSARLQCSHRCIVHSTLQLYILVPGLKTCQCYTTCCRLPQGDEVMTGAARNLVQQRLKLNSKVALVTGAAVAAKPGGFCPANFSEMHCSACACARGILVPWKRH